MEYVVWTLLGLGAAWAGLWAVSRFYLQGADLSAFDQPAGEPRGAGQPASAENQAVIASLGKVPLLLKDAPRSRHLALLRDYMDHVFPANEAGAQITPVQAGGVKAEWVLAGGADPSRRLLYIHGGAYIMGSPLSHRRLTTRFSEAANAVVLVIDYRLMPENLRMAGIEDSRAAYRWMLENGPDGASAASAVFVAGDSAGGNLTLSLIAWVRDQGLRAPDAAVALSPATDSTLASPSLKAHVRSDAMLGPLFGPLTKVPRALLLWLGWIQNRINPRSPLISPVYGDLSNLPPVLVHASEVEMLLDDSLRYVGRAQAAGSPVRLQTWDHMVHVWHIFNPELPEAREALEEIGKFLAAAATADRGPR